VVAPRRSSGPLANYVVSTYDIQSYKRALAGLCPKVRTDYGTCADNENHRIANTTGHRPASRPIGPSACSRLDHLVWDRAASDCGRSGVALVASPGEQSRRGDSFGPTAGSDRGPRAGVRRTVDATRGARRSRRGSDRWIGGRPTSDGSGQSDRQPAERASF
jgi:hypothetical protein